MENSTEEVSSDNGIEKNSNRIDFGEVNLVKDKIILNKISDILERFENNSKSGNDIIARDKKSSDILNNIEKILFFYENREKNLSNVKSLKIYENRFLELSLDDDSIYIFDILIFDILEEDESKFFVGSNGEALTNKINDLKLEKQRNISELIEKNRKFDRVLDAMEEIFTENGGVFGLGMLDEEDILNTDKYGNELKGKNIKELQLIARSSWHDIIKLRKGIKEEDINSNLKLLIVDSEKRYLNYIVGIGDKYEGGAKLFDKTQVEIIHLINHIISSKKDVKGIFEYYNEIHKEIDSNDRQSTNVVNMYRNFINKLNNLIFIELKKRNATDEELLEFVKLMTGRGNKTDWNMQDSETANLILVEIMGRKGGMLEKMYDNKLIEIKDKEIGNILPSKVVEDFVVTMHSITLEGENGEKKKLNGRDMIDMLGFNDLFNLKDKKYAELSMEEKVKISAIFRITKELKPKIEYKYDSWGGNIPYEIPAKTELSMEEFGNVMWSAGEKAKIDFQEAMEDSFTSDWLGSAKFDKEELMKYKDTSGNPIFSSTEAEAFELYSEINGVGWFDWSDSLNNGLAQFSLAVIPTIVGGILIAAGAAVVAPVVGGSALIYGATVGVGASISSWAVNGKGYDTLGEMGVDLSSDVIVGGTTGFAGGVAVKGVGLTGQKIFAKAGVNINPNSRLLLGFGKEGAEAFSRGWYTNQGIFVGDLAFLGIGPEVLRNMEIDKIFSDPNKLFEVNNNIDSIFL